jgi:hypothetical protein
VRGVGIRCPRRRADAADQVQELLNQMNQPMVAHALPADDESGDDPPDDT